MIVHSIHPRDRTIAGALIPNVRRVCAFLVSIIRIEHVALLEWFSPPDEAHREIRSFFGQLDF